MTSHTSSCPEGITRATILDLCQTHQIPHEVKNISLTEVYRADEPFPAGGRTVPAGSVIVPLNQPAGRLVRNLLDADRPVPVARTTTGAVARLATVEPRVFVATFGVEF
jgi:branched-subunit amino acid aminotransferase/4-amino-4-deoxychorismate lyase